jgi:hypothetical protein
MLCVGANCVALAVLLMTWIGQSGSEGQNPKSAGPEVRRWRQRRLAIVLFMMGIAELALASQQRFFWLADRWYARPAGPRTAVIDARSPSWELSLVAGILSIALAIGLTLRLRAGFCRAACRVFFLWGIIYSVLHVLAPHSGAEMTYPTLFGPDASSLRSAAFDWTRIAAWLVGPLTMGLGLWGASILGSCPQPLKIECQSCKYDLTGNVSAICPECGQSIQDEQKTFLCLTG